MNRIGNALLWVGGLGLAVLMAYTIALDAGFGGGRLHGGAGANAAEVAVFYPERTLWHEFRLGVRQCVRKKLADLVEETDTSVIIQTHRHRRLIRFDRFDVRGLRETKDEVTRLLHRPRPPIAVVGSSNTVLTEAIAQALRGEAVANERIGKGPVLLIPWASAVLSDGLEPGEGPVALLDILPGRTFRFCPNNQRHADSIVGALAHHDAKRAPRRIVIVVDRNDPYSLDLAASFHRAAERVAPEAEIFEHADSLSFPPPADPLALPSAAEERLAESIWHEAEAHSDEGTTWVMLPLQDEPTQRMIAALRRHAPRAPRVGDDPLRVVCGDAIGFTALSQLAGRCPFPIWSGTSASAPAAAAAVVEGMSPDTQITAEIVSALIRGVDASTKGPVTSDHLREALATLRIDANDPAAMGRPLAFRPSGERAGDALGHVLMAQPGDTTVFAISRGPTGQWSAPEPLRGVPVARQP